MADETLLEHLDELESGYNEDRMNLTISMPKSTLEANLGAVYDELKQKDLKKLHKKDVFSIYKECADVSDDLINDYLGEAKKFRQVKYSRKDDSKLRRLLNKTSGWYNKVWVKPDFYASNKDWNFMTHGLFSTGVMGPPIVATSLLGFAAVGVPASVLLWYTAFKHKTELLGVRYNFKRDVKQIVEDTYRLNYLAQRVREEVRDIEVLETRRKRVLISKYGVEGIRKKMLKAQNEVDKVIEYTAKVLLAAEVQPPQLESDYIPFGEAKRRSMQKEEEGWDDWDEEPNRNDNSEIQPTRATLDNEEL